MTTVKGRKWVVFECRAEVGADVRVAGTFNDWDPSQMKLKDKNGDGTFTTRLFLAPGRHEYKFIVNGNWSPDPSCQDSTPDGHGSVNSVITVG